MDALRLRQCLELHRGSPSPTLRFEPPFDRLMDSQLCAALVSALASYGTPWTQKLATPELWQQIPAAHGLYMFVWRPPLRVSTAEALPDTHVTFPWVLYIGRAGNESGGGTLRDRYKREYMHYVAGDPEALWDAEMPQGREALLRRYLRLQPLEYWWSEVVERSRIVPLEKRLIELLNPPLNVQHRRLVVKSVTPAF
jgi:hypothetical protein